MTFADPPGHLLEALDRACRDRPSSGVRMVVGRRGTTEFRTFVALRESIEQAARRLHGLGLGKRDRVLLCLPTSWSWLETWFAAVRLGALPVAISPPGALGSPEPHVRKALGVCELVEAKLFVATESTANVARELQRLEPTLSPMTTALAVEEIQAAPDDTPAPAVATTDPEEVAFLQLTSGSTGLQRAAMISHRAAISNAIACIRAVTDPHGVTTDRMASWLPLYHDMGLVGGIFYSLVNGNDLTLLRPSAFLARPGLWLEYFRGATTALAPAPNFAYRMCVERVRPEQRESLDLSGWRDILSGSEMVRPATMNAFCEAFEGAGVRPERIRPCYGMAESTLAVTMDQELKGLRTEPVPNPELSELADVVNNGRPVPGTTVRVVAGNGKTLGPREIGEVEIEGPSLFSGYWNDDVATTDSFREGRLLTGDLGFLNERGELFLVGRKKEILIVNGHNVMPHEIEWIAERTADSGGAQRCGAFSVQSDEGELAVLVLESTERDPEKVASLRTEISRTVGRELKLPLSELLIVRRGSIPRTSSGKVRRGTLKQLYLDQELAEL